ncbi:FecCD family ABC transporter permease [Lysobacter korlensis]|uniref:FecCD family ABC transporter permease n=1 Tax=Lysobacter korlensis TaxID=553636 RepID=A0ABV6RW17_9GAMM
MTAASALSTPLRATRAARRRHSTGVHAALGVLVLALAALGMSLGDYTIAVPDLVAALLGQGSGGDEFVVTRLRLPRVLLGALVGAALAVSGATFQAVLRNPIASPDIIGVTTGASAAAVAGLLLFGLSGAALSAVAFLGALVVALAIYLLARRGGVTGYRFALIGIAFAFVATSVLNYLLSRGDVQDAQAALVWLVGSLAGTGWDDVALVAVALVVLLPAALLLARPLSILQLGDDTATSLGIRSERLRLALLVVAVALAATATAATGPVAFVAFLAAPIARRLVSADRAVLGVAALVGGAMVLGADLVGQHLLGAGSQIPAGIITGAVGAPGLLWLLASTNRRGRGV